MSVFHVQIGALMNQAIVRDSVRPRTRLLLKQTLPLIILFATLVSQLWIRLMIIEHGYELEKVRTEALSNDARLRELNFTYAALTRPTLMREQANSQLTMVSTPPQYIRKISLLGEEHVKEQTRRK